MLHGDFCVASQNSTFQRSKAARAAGSEQSEAFVALQAQVKALSEGNARRDAEAFVDQAIRDKRVGVSSERESFIALHMESPERAAKIIGGLPRLDRTGTTIEPPALKQGEISLNSEQAAVAAMLGQSPKDYAETLKSERGEEVL